MKKLKKETKKTMTIMTITLLKIISPFAVVIILTVGLTVALKWRWTKSFCSALFVVGLALLARPLLGVLLERAKSFRGRSRKTVGRYAER